MLEIKELSAGYGKREVLRDLSLSLPDGKLTAVVGANGSGKSTLLRSVAGIIPYTGEIILDGVTTSSLSRAELSRRVSYLPQLRRAPDMTVEELVLKGRFPHLAYPRRYSEKDRQIALRAMEGLGISDIADRPLATLSGGMRQTAYLAMAVAQDAGTVLLDEPTAFLDASHAAALMRLLRRLSREGRCVAAVLHDLPLAFSFADSVAVVDGGRIVLSGTPSELAGSEALASAIGLPLLPTDDGGYRFIYGKST